MYAYACTLYVYAYGHSLQSTCLNCACTVVGLALGDKYGTSVLISFVACCAGMPVRRFGERSLKI